MGARIDGDPVVFVAHLSGYRIDAGDLVGAINAGVRKINVGSALKIAYFDALREACRKTASEYNPYEVVGSGLQADVLAAGRRAMTAKVAHYMRLFGSAGKAELA